MGCVLSTSLPQQVPLYFLHDPFEQVNLTFNFNRSVLHPDTTLIPFDDGINLLKGHPSMHIRSLSVRYTDTYIQGLAICYMIDGSQVHVQHNFSSTPVQRMNPNPNVDPRYDNPRFRKVRKLVSTLTMDEFEHIEFIACEYTKLGLTSLTMKTNTGQQLAVHCRGDPSVDNTPFKREINLRP